MSLLKTYNVVAKGIFTKYKKQVFKKDTLQDGEESSIIEIVDFALDTISDEYAFLLKKEFLEKSPKNWWDEYYSRSTFYRIKLKALQEFLEFLK